MTQFTTDNLDAKLNRRLAQGLEAYVWLYYKDTSEATTIDRTTIRALGVLFDQAGLDVYLDEIVTEAETAINKAGILNRVVGPTYDEDGELIR